MLDLDGLAPRLVAAVFRMPPDKQLVASDGTGDLAFRAVDLQRAATSGLIRAQQEIPERAVGVLDVHHLMVDDVLVGIEDAQVVACQRQQRFDLAQVLRRDANRK